MSNLSLNKRYALYLSIKIFLLFFFLLTILCLSLAKEEKQLRRKLKKETETIYRESQKRQILKFINYFREELFDPLYQLDMYTVERMIEHIKADMPIISVFITDKSGKILTDGTKSNRFFGKQIDIDPEKLKLHPVMIKNQNGNYKVRFSISSAGYVVGYGEILFSDQFLKKAITGQQSVIIQTWDNFKGVFKRIAFSAFLFSLLVGILSSIFLSRKLSKPLLMLKEAALKVQDGKLPKPLDLKCSGELCELADAFNTMAQKVYYYRIELESEIAKRMEEVESAKMQLVYANRLATLGEMAAGIAHEINQPLSIIRLLLQSLISNADEGFGPPLSQRVVEVLRKIDLQVERIDKIITHLRTFARQKPKDEPLEDIEINGVLRDILLIFSENLKLKRIEVKEEFCPLPLFIKGDINKIEQVFINLITNALEAVDRLPEGAKRLIYVKTALVKDDKVLVEISDTGPGIPKEIRDKVFEPFFTTKEVGKGMGLGLSISYGIVKEFGGEMGFSVKDGVGTKFFIIFPKSNR